MAGTRIDRSKLADYLVKRGVAPQLCSMARLDGFMRMCLNGDINLEKIDGKSLGVLIGGECGAGELEVIAERVTSSRRNTAE